MKLKRYIRDNGPIRISRSLKELAIKALEAKNEYYRKKGQEIKIEELANMLGNSKRRS